ncbi:type VI secretion system protein ImpF [Pseudoduganella flava]|uniref:Type VI secretion system baseplate subunit TssE n=1 Tax=Pseudoduganella flava TaxID=871742 RepID=A0A562PG76_9BURK|nr:type VI secretion system baseplate subunit TssE [Pseudoduganella flava]QGZ38912.1 type VI secretion system baseplate subunit TssE [Pseudoduganella flava]TWI42986.1 type VI secretion system protein ImpF [Pseudoduganella flava]
MNGHTPSLFDRLLGDRGYGPRMTLEQLKDAVARDLEDLLNTRMALPEEMLAAWPECAASILSYGLIDIAGMCLSSSGDRERICASLRAAIERHEPRLRNVQAHVELAAGTVNRINFVITGVLHAPGVTEPINFDAVLQPSTLHYSIRRNARGSA